MDLAEVRKTHELLHQTKSIFCIIIKPFWYKYQQILHVTVIHHINHHLTALFNFSFHAAPPGGCPSCDTHAYDIVCGSDDVTYQSYCFLRTAACDLMKNIKLVHKGPCRGKKNTSIATYKF